MQTFYAEGARSTIADEESADSDDSEKYEETWAEWIQRATGIPEAKAKECHISNWADTQRDRMWEWAGHVMRREYRKQGHPPKRWADRLDRHMKHHMNFRPGEWVMLTPDREVWRSWKSDFRHYE